MPDLGRYLRHFRRLVSPPGRPGPIGVPADHLAELSEELEAVFRAVDAIQEEADRIRKDSESEARKKQEEAEDEAGRIVADARDRAEQVRAEEAARQRRDIEKDAQTALDQAEQQAEETRKRANEKLDSMVELIVGSLSGTAEEGAR